jgi:hypothetical protein
VPRPLLPPHLLPKPSPAEAASGAATAAGGEGGGAGGAAVKPQADAGGGRARGERQADHRDSVEAVSRLAAALQLRGATPLNPEQRLAVAALLAGGGRELPYALFGPPGTGKRGFPKSTLTAGGLSCAFDSGLAGYCP